MAKFQVVGRYDLDAEDVVNTHGLIRALTPASIATFQGLPNAQRKGVYIFSLKGQGGSVMPWYVGMARAQSFAQEAMTKDKLRKYASAMFGRTGKPVITLVAAPAKGAKTEAIDRLETLLIWIARDRNPALVNVRKVESTPQKIIGLVNEIEISGVLNKNPGQPSNHAVDFRSMMGLS